MKKWDKKKFLEVSKEKCEPHIANLLSEIVIFTEQHADNIAWGRGEGNGSMLFKCKTLDYGVLPLFNVSTTGQIKFQLNYLRKKVSQREIVRDYQIKLESNFMMDFDSEIYPVDIFHDLGDLFIIKSELDKFFNTILGIIARLQQ